MPRSIDQFVTVKPWRWAALAKKETHYAFRKIPEGYQAIKMSPKGETLDVYKLTPNGGQCSCPAHVYCRHQQMLKIFLDNQAIGTGHRYCFETGVWFPPEKIDKKGGLYEGLFDDEGDAPHLVDI
jgi:hypothetical protein